MKSRRKLLLGCLMAAVVVLLLLALDNRLVVRRYTVESDKLTERVRLAIVSDLHSCAYGEGQKELLDAVAAEEPDLVLLPGDIVDDVLPEDNAWTVLEALAERWPCCYVTGNHEWWSGEAERICQEIEALGIHVLRGENVSITVKGQAITVFGIDDPDSGEDQFSKVSGAGGEGYTILLAHRPEKIDDYLSGPFDLIVSGHAHGGQWRLPGLINGLYAPNQGLFPQYAGGRYDFGAQVFLVSRGLARESTRVPRLFNPPELVIADLVPVGASGAAN